MNFYLYINNIINRTSLKIPIPTKSHRERRNSFKQEANKNKDNSHKKMPR